MIYRYGRNYALYAVDKENGQLNFVCYSGTITGLLVPANSLAKLGKGYLIKDLRTIDDLRKLPKTIKGLIFSM